jgi:hypothetical protein
MLIIVARSSFRMASCAKFFRARNEQKRKHFRSCSQTSLWCDTCFDFIRKCELMQATILHIYFDVCQLVQVLQ